MSVVHLTDCLYFKHKPGKMHKKRGVSSLDGKLRVTFTPIQNGCFDMLTELLSEDGGKVTSARKLVSSVDVVSDGTVAGWEWEASGETKVVGGSGGEKTRARSDPTLSLMPQSQLLSRRQREWPLRLRCTASLPTLFASLW